MSVEPIRDIGSHVTRKRVYECMTTHSHTFHVNTVYQRSATVLQSVRESNGHWHKKRMSKAFCNCHNWLLSHFHESNLNTVWAKACMNTRNPRAKCFACIECDQMMKYTMPCHRASTDTWYIQLKYDVILLKLINFQPGMNKWLINNDVWDEITPSIPKRQRWRQFK